MELFFIFIGVDLKAIIFSEAEEISENSLNKQKSEPTPAISISFSSIGNLPKEEQRLIENALLLAATG